MQENQPVEKNYQFLVHSVSECTKLAKSFKFDKKHEWHKTLILLYGSILELSEAVYLLIEKKSAIGVPILTRAILEAF